MDKYQIIKVIGEGNYGKAVLVTSLIDQKFYVIKSIDISNFNKEQLNNALYEVNVIKNLKHPYITHYIESFYEENFLCIVMDYADCGDLYKFVKSQKRINILLKEEVILNWFTQLCFAVKYLHEKNILHRDLKLSNIFLTSNGDILLGDFGISKVLNDKEQFAKTIVGTPYYLSPEICLKRPYDRKSDIWSMGCLLFELMNLRHAFEANNIGELILKILKGEHDPMNENYSKDIRNLAKEMLNIDSNIRPEINDILKKPLLLKHIKLNLLKQVTFINNNNKSYTKLKEKKEIKEKEIITNSSDNSSLNLKYCYNPILNTPTSFNEEINIYRIESDSSSKISSDRITIGHKSNNSKIENAVKNVQEEKSVFSKIEMLKKILEKYFGFDNFIEIYFKVKDDLLKEKELFIELEKYNIKDTKLKEDITKILKSLVKLENDLY